MPTRPPIGHRIWSNGTSPTQHRTNFARRHHLLLDLGRMAVRGVHPRCLRPSDRRLADRQPHAHRSRARRLGDGRLATSPNRRLRASLRRRQPSTPRSVAPTASPPSAWQPRAAPSATARQRHGRRIERHLQSRTHRLTRAMAEPTAARDRHRRMDRLVQPPPPPLSLRNSLPRGLSTATRPTAGKHEPWVHHR